MESNQDENNLNFLGVNLDIPISIVPYLSKSWKLRSLGGKVSPDKIGENNIISTRTVCGIIYHFVLFLHLRDNFSDCAI